MTRTGNVPTFGTLLRDLSADPAAVDEVARAARANSPEVARLPADEVRRQVVLLLGSGLGALERHEDPAGRDFAEARRLGADRAAQGVSVAGLLRGVQAGRDRAVELVVRHGRAAGIADEVLLEGLLTIGRYAAAVERAVVDGHRAAERDLLRTGAAARAHLLRRLLRDGPAGTLPAELTRVGLRPDGRYHCLVAAPPDPVRAHALHRQLIRHGGLLGTVDDRLAGLLPRLPEAAPADLLTLVAPAQPLERAPAMYALCLAALTTAAHRRLGGLRQVTDLAGETALAAQPVLAELLRGTLLGPLDPADDFHRELAGTALAWLHHGRRLDQTAAALHVHPNTVRYRLRRLRELTGGPPVEEGARCTVPETVHWWWALRSWLDGG
ncbi:helix-turn-helix domain-containing protein [Micromonospora sp. C32]|uniref:helix-turn-helix domain-containing protein n=1 Tax=Micromonospora sp. C32 TaxID=2824877 RepID=UPI001B396354|nr:helix-turn-helix domain-containing protein [Micromonospora sp. C32]MBQ1056348.1 helix-turn-helix domain-containing protein [Micromonospora sp. C32]